MRENTKSDAKKRLARISGQVNGLQKMIDDERYCVDILTQVAALRAALDQFGVLMLTEHLQNCVFGEHEHGGGEDHCRALTKTEQLDEIRTTLNRFLK